VKVLVTGGSGLVGGLVLRALVTRGDEVVGLARSDDAANSISGAGARPARGDVLDPGSLADAMTGCEIVFHAAGVNAMCMRDPGSLFETNVEGAANVVRAARGAGVRRVVCTSSAATIGEAHGTIGREDSEHRGTFLSRYEESKFLGERSALALGHDLGIEVVCVNPSSVQGPGRTTGSARLLLDLLNGRLPIIDTTLSIVDVEDCTAAHLAAAESGTAGERYLVSGATLTTRQAVGLLRTETGLPRRVWRLPRAAAALAGVAGGAAAAILRRDMPMCPELARTLLHGHRYDGSYAERELGFAYTPISRTIRRTVDWYERQGLVADGRRAGAG
jgi:dihydroflavonol-4-reductase